MITILLEQIKYIRPNYTSDDLELVYGIIKEAFDQDLVYTEHGLTDRSLLSKIFCQKKYLEPKHACLIYEDYLNGLQQHDILKEAEQCLEQGENDLCLYKNEFEFLDKFDEELFFLQTRNLRNISKEQKEQWNKEIRIQVDPSLNLNYLLSILDREYLEPYSGLEKSGNADEGTLKRINRTKELKQEILDLLEVAEGKV